MHGKWVSHKEEFYDYDEFQLAAGGTQSICGSRQPIQYTACVGLSHMSPPRKKFTPLDWSATGLFLLDQEPTVGGGVAGAHGRPRS
eukprot:COSAG05_NODE_16323_length_348_cov_1.156627_1_plen_86_part_00